MNNWYIIVISLIFGSFEYTEHISLKYNLDIYYSIYEFFFSLLHFFIKFLFILFTYKILILSMSFILYSEEWKTLKLMN